MSELILAFGIAARNAVLAAAALLKSEAVPGLIAVALVLGLAVLIVVYARSIVNHAAYCASWAPLLRTDPNALATAATQGLRAADYLAAMQAPDAPSG